MGLNLSLRAAGAAIALLLAFAGGPSMAEPARCVAGQAEIRPLQQLTIETPHGAKAFKVELAATGRQREIGLMCRMSLGPDRGMLFDFRKPQAVAFWMRNTLIPLDILYIRPDGRILSIARNARPLDESLIPSGGAILGVLELRGGRAAELGLLPGDRVRHPMFDRR
ncbi:DUF192 domain-containing protein [Phenylobacterium immobile]|uniref:DUF192 domain-containing protein n=1 Tax=Phenylobacterium immobile TaxID=21 RepID=UPI000B2F2F91|nr:DUF192 domain-containing protein [Phenylobacterium immobile]